VAGVLLLGAKRDVFASDGRCFFGAGNRGCHCGWSWTQARPGASGRAPFPFVGVCGPLSPVSVILLYSATTINVFCTVNKRLSDAKRERTKDV
jgi:hypothetical protein